MSRYEFLMFFVDMNDLLQRDWEGMFVTFSKYSID